MIPRRGAGLAVGRLSSLSLLLGAVVLGLSPAAYAGPSVDAATFRPALHPGDLLGVRSARVAGSWQWAAGTYVTYVRDPLRLVAPDTDRTLHTAVDSRLTATPYGSLGVAGRLDLAVAAPLAFSSGEEPRYGSGLEAAEAAATGDLRLSVKGALLGGSRRGFGLALLEEVTVPTASGGSFSGDAGFTSTSLVVTDYAWRGWRIAANAGVRLRGSVEVAAAEVGSELLGSLAGSFPVRCGVAELLGSAEGRTALSDPFGSRFTDALDLLGGARVRLGRLALSAAAGGGLLEGFGSPALQALLQVAWELEYDPGCAAEAPPPAAPAPPPAPAPPADGDGDGVPDPEDTCPEDAGPPAAGGCPDRDEDGVRDGGDRCPELAGPAEDEGCPDQDRDGVPDPDDRCPEHPGAAELSGCGDRDGDGVADPDDRCPDVGGMTERNGCPEDRVAVEGKQREIRVQGEVRFQSSKAVIELASVSPLLEVARVLDRHPEIARVRVEGHTDKSGVAEENLELSQQRAQAVMRFLIGAGVAADRLEAVGYGDSRPIADNSTVEGRATNRRVVFRILDPPAAEKKGGPAPAQTTAPDPPPAQPKASPPPAAVVPQPAPTEIPEKKPAPQPSESK